MQKREERKTMARVMREMCGYSRKYCCVNMYVSGRRERMKLKLRLKKKERKEKLKAIRKQKQLRERFGIC